MIIIEFKQGQGLGNQLWCFASAKSISKKNKTKLAVRNLEKFKANNFLNLDFDIEYNNENFEYFNEKLYYDIDLKYISSDFDKRVENLSPSKNFLLNGLFQSEKYFFNNFKLLKKWIVPKFKIKINLKLNSCIINLRGGEYKRHKKFILPFSYWQNAIDYMKHKFNINDFIVVTDDYNYAKALFPNYKIISNDIELCFNYIYSCSNIIVSNSSFSYFPINLSPIKKIVIAPKNWARFSSKENRWSSPANFYKSWLYMDQFGKVYKYNQLLSAVKKTVEFYEKNKLLYDDKLVNKWTLRSLIPSFIKKYIKKIGGKLFPKHIG